MSEATGTVSCIACGRPTPQDQIECAVCGEVQALTPGVTAEMMRAIRKHECLVYGHDWEIVNGVMDRPQGVACRRCGTNAGLKRCNCGHH